MESGQHVPAAAWQPQPIDSGDDAIHIAELEVRPDSRQVIGAGGRVQLTGRELDVLMTLIEQPDRVVTRDAIFAHVWGGPMPYRDRAVDVYVRRVREKLRILSPELSYIHTHFGIGYRFWPQPATAD